MLKLSVNCPTSSRVVTGKSGIWEPSRNLVGGSGNGLDGAYRAPGYPPHQHQNEDDEQGPADKVVVAEANDGGEDFASGSDNDERPGRLFQSEKTAHFIGRMTLAEQGSEWLLLEGLQGCEFQGISGAPELFAFFRGGTHEHAARLIHKKSFMLPPPFGGFHVFDKVVKTDRHFELAENLAVFPGRGPRSGKRSRGRRANRNEETLSLWAQSFQNAFRFFYHLPPIA